TNGSWKTLFQTYEELDADDIALPLVQNKQGKLGALLSNQFIYEWIGVSSFIFVFMFFLVGYRLLYELWIVCVVKSVLYASVGILFISVTFCFFYDYYSNSPHILEGKFGYCTNQMLNAQVGKVGTGGILLFILLTFLILVFNFDLRFSF